MASLGSCSPFFFGRHSEREEFLDYLLYLDSRNTFRSSSKVQPLHRQARHLLTPLSSYHNTNWRSDLLHPGTFSRSPSRSLSSFSGAGGWGTSVLGQWGASGYGYATHQHQHSASLSKLDLPASFNKYFAFYPCKYCRLTYIYRSKNKSSFVPDQMDSLLPMLVKARCSGLHCKGSDHKCETPLHSINSGFKQYSKLALPDQQKLSVYRPNGYKAMMDLAVMCNGSLNYPFILVAIKNDFLISVQ